MVRDTGFLCRENGKEVWNISPACVEHFVSSTTNGTAKKEIFIYENVTYRTREEVYRAIYQDYQKLKAEDPDMPNYVANNVLSKSHGYSPISIDKILKIMTMEDPMAYIHKKKHLTSSEAYKRDKAIFIDYLKWTGTRREFCKMAAEKYDLSVNYVEQILFYVLEADEKRYDMV